MKEEDVTEYLMLEGLTKKEADKLKTWYVGISDDPWMTEHTYYFHSIKNDLLVYEIEYDISCMISDRFDLPLKLLWMDMNQREQWYLDRNAKEKEDEKLRVLDRNRRELFLQKEREIADYALYEKLKDKYERGIE